MEVLVVTAVIFLGVNVATGIFRLICQAAQQETLDLILKELRRSNGDS